MCQGLVCVRSCLRGQAPFVRLRELLINTHFWLFVIKFAVRILRPAWTLKPRRWPDGFETRLLAFRFVL